MELTHFVYVALVVAALIVVAYLFVIPQRSGGICF
jgi:hypothetical protein